MDPRGMRIATMPYVSPVVRWLLIAAATAGAAAAQHAGDVPPALVWDKLKGNCPASLDWPGLHGRVVVAAFSSSFPFPSEISQWNQIAERVVDEPVLFLQVVEGSEFLLDQAIDKTPYQGCILLDQQGTNLRNFGLPESGTTVVVNSQGWIAGYSQAQVREASVRAVLTGQKTAALAEFPAQPHRTVIGEIEGETSWEVHISRAVPGSRRALSSAGPEGYTARNRSLKVIIADLWETPPSRIVFPDDLDEGAYDVTAHIPQKNKDRVVQLVREAVEQRFGLSVQSATRNERVYLMTASQVTTHLQPAKDGEEPMTGSTQDSLMGTAQNMQDIARVFEDSLHTPVIEQTGVPGKYDFSATSALAEPASYFDMARQLGLQLTESRRPVDMLIVEKVR